MTRDYRRWWVFSFCGGSKLARDIAGGAVLVLIVTGILPRAGIILSSSSSVVYTAFPDWAQAFVLAAYAGQLGAETWGGQRDRFAAAALSLTAAAMSVALFVAAGAPGHGGAWQWTGHALCQFAVCFVLARDIGRADHAP